MDLKALFHEHIAKRQSDAARILSHFKLDGMVLGAGELVYYFEDDMAMPFRTAHHFAHWCPVPGENHLLLVRPGRKPKLFHHAPADFWHEHAPLGQPFWLDEFEVEQAGSVDDLWDALGEQKNTVYLGPDVERAKGRGFKTAVPGLLERLNWERAYKSDYEIAAMSEANRIGADGHRAALDAFLAGGSELDIHYAFLSAMRATDLTLPYQAIVGLNEKAAVLHYHGKRDDVRDGRVLLIDAGAQYLGYASDITRTYTASGADATFVSVLDGMNKMQLELCAKVRPGMNMGTLHHETHMGIAEILTTHDILKGVSPDQAVERGFTRAFFPHGLGHLLGLLVHDVAGKQKDPDGTPCPAPAKHPYLRSARDLDAGLVVTIEPGLYFIEMLLAPFRANEHRGSFNWGLIDRLMPMGGIRIEDDVLVTATGHRNLTNEHLPH